MLAGTFIYVIYLVLATQSVYAAEAEETAEVEPYNPMMRIALMCGAYIGTDYKMMCDNGFTFGYTESRTFTPIASTDVELVHVARDYNLTTYNYAYVVAEEGDKLETGAYHVKLACSDDKLDLLRAFFSDVNVYPAYQNGVVSLLMGQYFNEAEALEAKTALLARTENVTLPEGFPLQELQEATVDKPSDTGVLAIDGMTNTILWEFDQSDKSKLFGVTATQKGEKITYLHGFTAGVKYAYAGVIECNPSVYGTKIGLSVINQLPLETYVAGVLPWEISNSWPIETQKAFAIAVRSYAVANRGKHASSYGADLCNSDDCQVYRGHGYTNEAVYEAVNGTAGVIAKHYGGICATYYSSSTGGCTANVWEVWMARIGYLKAVATPWERYREYGNGYRTKTVTGQQIYETLKARGYKALTGAVTDITYTTGENTSYVVTITFTDVNGNTLTINKCDTIRINLSSFVNSANFVVGKAGETVERINYTKMGFGASTAEPTLGVGVLSSLKEHTVIGRQPFYVITADGVKNFTDTNSELIVTGKGNFPYSMSHSLDSSLYPTVNGVNGRPLPDILRLQTLVETEALTLPGDKNDDNTFVFVSRGWGHGVGMSQFGAKDLGDLGYDYQTIFKAYYSDVDLVTFTG